MVSTRGEEFYEYLIDNYIINREFKDLVHSRQNFEALFEKQSGWEGISGRSPDESEFQKALTGYELFSQIFFFCSNLNFI